VDFLQYLLCPLQVRRQASKADEYETGSEIDQGSSLDKEHQNISVKIYNPSRKLRCQSLQHLQGYNSTGSETLESSV